MQCSTKLIWIWWNLSLYLKHICFWDLNLSCGGAQAYMTTFKAGKKKPIRWFWISDPCSHIWRAIKAGTRKGDSASKTLKDTSTDQSPCQNKNIFRREFPIFPIGKKEVVMEAHQWLTLARMGLSRVPTTFTRTATKKTHFPGDWTLAETIL